MKTKILMLAAASMTLAISAPVLAQKANTADNRTQARQNSQGRANASDRGRERANANSALAGVQPGAMVHDRNGKMLGRVKEVKRAPDGTIIVVVVILSVTINGATTVQLSPSSLSFVDGMLVTSQITVPAGS